MASEQPERKMESGIIYLSTIPPTMNVKTIRQFFSKFGQTGNIFLKPSARASKKSMYYFTEGWIEFKNKKIAKRVATSLHNTQVGGKRRYKYYDSLWNMKYLHKFRWIHLNERLAHEKATHDQRMRAEIAQVKRETDHYVESVEKSKRLKRLETKMRKEGKEWKDAPSADIRQIGSVSVSETIASSSTSSMDDTTVDGSGSLLDHIFLAK